MTSSPPCWWTKTKDLSLASFVHPPAIDLIHDSRHVGLAIIVQISYTSEGATEVREVIMNILTTQMICFTFIECLSPK